MHNNNQIKAVIFDMDGVIVDGETLQTKSWEKVLKEYGIKPIYNKNGLIHLVGPTGDEGYQYVIDKHNLKEDLEILRKKRRTYYGKLINKKLIQLPGVLELIKRLKKQKITIALASNRIREHVEIMINNVGLKNFFEIIVTKNINIKPKPSPDIYLETVKQLHLKSNECVALEDTETGVISAKMAKIKVIAIPTNYTTHQNFSKADKIVGSLKEINIDLLNSL